MKKILALVICVLMCVSLFSCEEAAPPESEQQNPTDALNNEGSASKSNGSNKKPSSLKPCLTPNECARQAYEEVLKNERPLYSPLYLSSGETEHYFQDIIYFNKFETPVQAVIDMDKDGVEEMVIIGNNGGKTVLLHYENDKVYGYSFSEDAMDTIFVDGSFSWRSYNSFGNENGISRISFVNGRLKFKELIRTENYSKFYLNGVEVTRGEYEEHLATLRMESIEFTPFDLSLVNEGKALALASEHWGIKQGEFDDETGYRYCLTVYKDGEQYRVCLYWFVNNSYYDHLKCVLVNTDTGEISNPTNPDAKG